MTTDKISIHLSLIIPIIRHSTAFLELLEQLKILSNLPIELIIINQTNRSYADMLVNFQCHCLDLKPATALSAPRARNFGFENSSGNYVLFLDDDASIASDINFFRQFIKKLSDFSPDIYVAQRGEIKDGKYKSHWPNNTTVLTARNFPRIAIEWNIIIKRSVFENIGGFFDIGPGSDHSAQCGEGYIIVANALRENANIVLCPELQIAHPSLFGTPKNLWTVLAYNYGAGFGVGLTIPDFKFVDRIYWLLRVSAAAAKDLFGSKRSRITVSEETSLTPLKIALAKARIKGFCDGLFRKRPVSKDWIKKLETKAKA